MLCSISVEYSSTKLYRKIENLMAIYRKLVLKPISRRHFLNKKKKLTLKIDLGQNTHTHNRNKMKNNYKSKFSYKTSYKT